MPKISVAIPMYEFGGMGAEVLEFSFKILQKQTFKDFNIVISDHSVDKTVEETCWKWNELLDIEYIRNDVDRGSGASNFNNVLRHCKGEYIKLLCGDDYLFDEYSLEKTAAYLKGDEWNWLASSYLHTNDRVNFFRQHMPRMNEQIYAVNTIGSPSGVTLKNVDMPLFDVNLSYCYDCDFYYQYYLKYGNPRILPEVTVVNYLWNNSVSASMTQEKINEETLTVMRKYGKIQ